MSPRFLIPILTLLFQLAAQPLPESLFDGLSWRMAGPFRGGRAETATGVPGDPNTFYFGAVGGGIWKTTDAGTVWTPVFDGQHIASIGAIEVAPSDPNIIYAGTGETDLRSEISFGDGLYKSTDAGKTWRHIGLRDSRQIGRILVHPTNPDIVYVAALGHAYAPNEERGVFRSGDGGQTWRKVLYKGPETGAVDLAWVPEDPRTIYATLWNVRRPAREQYGPIEGPGSGLYKSTDGGDTWIQIQGHGLPEGEWHRAGAAVARGTHGRRVYALIDTKGGGLFRSDDAGRTWMQSSADRRITGRGWYFGRLTVDPANADVVYLPNVGLFRTADAGKTFSIVRSAPGGDDYHYLWIDPNAPTRMILATDQGATISVDGGRTWTTWYNQPTAQIYHVITDNSFPYTLYGTQQDSGSVAVPSRTDHGVITEADRYSIGGSESGYVAPDPDDPNIIYVAGTFGELARFDKRTAQSQNITPWPSIGFEAVPSVRKYRFPWTPPLVFSPIEHHTLYYAAQVLFKTTDGGLNWREISPDLTGASKQGVIFTIAPSPLQAGEIWVGSDTGLIHLTRDGGKTWSDTTPPGLTEWSKVTRLEASHFDSGTAYAAIDRHRLDDYRAYLFRTRDYGKTWTPLTAGIPEPAYLNAIREDPVRRGLLYAGTELGVYVSFDDGEHWQSLQLNLPVCSVRDIDIRGYDLAIATNGRSFWIMDDIAALREANKDVAAAAAWLYEPARAIRTASEAFQGTPLPPEIPQAPNPPDGAIIDYFLAGVANDPVTLEILDAKNQIVRKFASTDKTPARDHAEPLADVWITPPRRITSRAGMNRFVWDLRYAAPGMAGPQVLPGTYQVRLSVAGRSYSQTVDVALDPRSGASREDLESQFDLSMKAVHSMEQAARAMAEVQADQTKPAEIIGALRKASSDLRSVLQAAESADRRPPAQAWALYREAAQVLSALALRNSAKPEAPHAP